MSATKLDDTQACACSLEEHLKAALEENRTLRAANEQLEAALDEITQQRIYAQHMAHHDGLTGLPNRQMLMQRLQDGIAESFAHQRLLALMFIDIDGFKVVNDSHGHSAGDKLLAVLATRIASAVRADDLACRYGGDEFVVILSDISEAAVVARVAEDIRSHVNGRYSIDGQELQISASIGYALYPTDGDQWDSLLSSADASMYRDKHSQMDRRLQDDANHQQL
ncbi:GGDEF domain-containing protein [uncultured Nevskia sp.]|uniref:GGDEF domain-containing protein n=1 Tax=uncultured Nevskia sp. TaxID=228950 RepID=UPI0025F466A9|nr:GGDEF domain-containing protein [uncultured Nevskia sp.]